MTYQKESSNTVSGTRVLVLNSSSSSVKYQLLDIRDSSRLSPAGARVAVAVVPTDEELEIATQTYALVGETGQNQTERAEQRDGEQAAPYVNACEGT